MTDNSYVAFFDLETQDKISQMPGCTRADKVARLQISVACVLCVPTHLCISSQDAQVALENSTHRSFWRSVDGDVNALIDLLRNAKAVVGYNLFGFDYHVLKKHAVKRDMINISSKTLDIFARVRDTTGCWFKLDDLLQQNGKAAKTANGIEAIAMFERGEFDLLEQYCKADVERTAELSLLETLKVTNEIELPSHVFSISAFLRSMGV